MRKPKPPLPVTAKEVEQAVLKALVDTFDGRPMTILVAAHGLSLAALHLNMCTIQSINEKGKR
jgi:hypothetical protein